MKFDSLEIGQRFRYYRGVYVKTAKNEAVSIPVCGYMKNHRGGIKKLFRHDSMVEVL